MTRAASAPTAIKPSLDDAQIAFFARNGYLQLEAAVSSADCDHLVDKTWEQFPKHWIRHDPASWNGDVQDSCHAADLNFRRGHLKYQLKSELSNDPVVDRCFRGGSPSFGAALGLIERPLVPIRIRGLYPNVPAPHRDQIREFTVPHVEAHPAHLVAITYLNDVGPRAGGLLVWPGSHLDLFPAFESKLDFAKTPRYDALFTAWSKLQPIELTGRKGDVILTHHRLFHAPSLNRSDTIRFAFLCDYVTKDFQEQCKQPAGGIWDDWSPRLRTLDPGALAPAEALPVWSEESRKIRTAFAPTNDSTLNKIDASEIARSRHPGEVWLWVSDALATPEVVALDPTGGTLGPDVAVTVNGERLRSRSRNGFVCPVPFGDDTITISISGLKNPCLLRVIEIRHPFTASAILEATSLPATPDLTTVTVRR